MENTRHTRGKIKGKKTTNRDVLVEAIAGFDEGVELLVSVLDHICVQLDAVVHPKRSCWHKSTGLF